MDVCRDINIIKKNENPRNWIAMKSKERLKNLQRLVRANPDASIRKENLSKFARIFGKTIFPNGAFLYPDPI
ncbi:hypothetical protein CHU00_13725 [Sphingobacterium cellulitidis]|nr:hypothetical protein CHU00_13725 [Sphingobacterium cellulitidis]